MKKLLLLIPFMLVGCVSSEDQSRNLDMMMGIRANQLAEQSESQRIYQQDLENQQRQQMIDLQKKQLQQQNQSRTQTYSVMDEKGNMKTYTITKDPYSMGSPTGK